MPLGLWDLLAQLAGRQPTIDPGGGGTGLGPPIPGAPGAHYPLPTPAPTPVPMAPGQPYPLPGQGPPDTGFDLWRGRGGYYAAPNPNFFPGPGSSQPLPPYTGAPAQGPLAPWDRWAPAQWGFPPPAAQVWGVPVLPEALRSRWTDLLQEYQRQQALGRF